MQVQARQLRRVIYVAPDVPIPFPSGASVHVSELAESLSAAGHEVHVVARRMGERQRPEEKLGGVTLHRVYRLILSGQPHGSSPGGRTDAERTGLFGRLYYAYLVTVFALYVSMVVSRLVKRNGIDLILERETAFGAGGIASFITRRPLILEIIGPRYSQLSARRSTKILYYTESMLGGGIEKAKCVPVSAGVNLDLFKSDRAVREATRKELGVQNSLVIGYVGTFQDWHGVDILFQAIGLVRAKGIPMKLVLVGPHTQENIQLSKALGILQECIFVGPTNYEEVPAYVNACDIMVAPYNPSANSLRREYGIGFPLKLLEYMACEKPFISTKVDPIRQIPSVSEAGVLVGPGDPEVLADAMIELARNEGARLRMGQTGRALVERGFSWAPLAARISTMIQAA